jgi:F-type H+-transporting ATPase subunit a
MKMTPDQTVFWSHGFITINLTLVTTWTIMLFMVIGAKLITRNLKSNNKISRWQCVLEMIVTSINEQINDVGLPKPELYIGFIGTLFLFVAMCNFWIILPWYQPPTGSLSTTTALALCVFLSVPYFGIQKSGIGGYLKTYIQPTFIMLPFNIIRTIQDTGTCCKAVRQYHERGNDRRDFIKYYAFVHPDSYEGAGFAYRYGAGLYFQHTGNRVHCRRSAGKCKKG